jgi:hypothetical protein
MLNAVAIMGRFDLFRRCRARVEAVAGAGGRLGASLR